MDGVESVSGPVAEGDEGVLVQATLEPQPYSTEAFDLIDPIREAASGAAEGTLVGGASAVEFDVREAAAWDSMVIPPIVLVVVFLILVLLLRAVIAPLVLIGTVILSFLAALGVGYLVFDVIFGFPGSDPSLPLFAFVFLVALGVDYNIFLVARAREETLKHGTAAGMLRALAVTGGVITSAGIVLAGDLLGAGGAAARVPDRDRLRGRVRRAARHLPRAQRAGAGDGARAGAALLVAVVALAHATAGARRVSESATKRLLNQPASLPERVRVEPCGPVAGAVAAGLAARAHAQLGGRQAEQLELAVVGVAGRLVAHPAHGTPALRAARSSTPSTARRGAAYRRAQPERAVAAHLVERERPAQRARRPSRGSGARARARRGGRGSRCRPAPRRRWPRARRRSAWGSGAEPPGQRSQHPEARGVVVGAGGVRRGVRVGHHHVQAGARTVVVADHVARAPAPQHGEALHGHGEPARPEGAGQR